MGRQPETNPQLDNGPTLNVPLMATVYSIILIIAIYCEAFGDIITHLAKYHANILVRSFRPPLKSKIAWNESK